MSVYFAKSGDYIKIGYSANPAQRAQSITRLATRPAAIKYKDPVELIGWVPGNMWREGVYHAQHIDRRVAGEWFSLDVDYVRELIWQDPRGVDLLRMSAWAVFACIENPDLTRDEIAASGVPVLATTLGGAA